MWKENDDKLNLNESGDNEGDSSEGEGKREDRLPSPQVDQQHLETCGETTFMVTMVLVMVGGEDFHIGCIFGYKDSDYRVDIGWELNNRQDHLWTMFLCDIYHVNVSSSQTGKIE